MQLVQSGGCGIIGDPSLEVVEHPLVTAKKVQSRQRPAGQVIVFANEKGGVGKSTLAFHSAIALCTSGAKVAVVDLDLRQQSLAKCLENRDRTSRCLQITLPSPNKVVLRKQSGGQLSQEIARIGRDCDYVIIDLPGYDSPTARYAITMADTLVTPVNSSCFDLDLLGRFDPISGRLQGAGHFAQLVTSLNEARLTLGMEKADWIVVKNRVRSAETKQQIRIENALQELASETQFRISQGLKERVMYRELLPFGLTQSDLRLIPDLAGMKRSWNDEVAAFLADLQLKEAARSSLASRTKPAAKICSKVVTSFSISLQEHVHPTHFSS